MGLDRFSDVEFLALDRHNTDGFVDDMTELEVYNALSQENLLGGAVAAKTFVVTLDT